MHLRFVEMFCDVAFHGSFSKAAAAHKVSQPSASQAVQTLEDRLGTLLIDRSKRPLELTPAGAAYYDGCREMLELYRKVEDRVLAIRDEVVGTVRVAAIYSVGLSQMECYAKQFTAAHPHARLKVEYLHPEEVYQQVLNDEADVGLVSFPRDNSELVSHLWQEQKMVLVVHPKHRLAAQGSVPVSELEGEDFVGFTPELTIRKVVYRWLKQSHVTVRRVHEFDNIESIKQAIEDGSGMGILPLPTVQREVTNGTLSALSLSDVNWVRPLGVIHKRNKVLGNAVARFVELVRKTAQADCPGADPHDAESVEPAQLEPEPGDPEANETLASESPPAETNSRSSGKIRRRDAATSLASTNRPEKPLPR